jgi:hypothetical protein
MAAILACQNALLAEYINMGKSKTKIIFGEILKLLNFQFKNKLCVSALCVLSNG